MSNIPTAEEFVNQYDWENSTLDIPSVLIEFAKLHVEAALEAAAKASSNHQDSKEYSGWLDEDIILTAYPETNIK